MLFEEDMHRLGNNVVEVSHNQVLFERCIDTLQELCFAWLRDDCVESYEKAQGLIAALEPEFDFARAMHSLWDPDDPQGSSSFIKYMVDQKGWVFAYAWKSYIERVIEDFDLFSLSVKCIEKRSIAPIPISEAV